VRKKIEGMDILDQKETAFDNPICVQVPVAQDHGSCQWQLLDQRANNLFLVQIELELVRTSSATLQISFVSSLGLRW